jgi:hypothetical protein
MVYSGIGDFTWPSRRAVRGLGKANPYQCNVVVEFTNIGTGLKIRDGDAALKGFVAAGADKVFYEATAVLVDGQTVSLSSASVPSPVTVRYGWAKNPDCNLYNSADLHAAPFRSDEWPSGYRVLANCSHEPNLNKGLME